MVPLWLAVSKEDPLLLEMLLLFKAKLSKAVNSDQIQELAESSSEPLLSRILSIKKIPNIRAVSQTKLKEYDRIYPDFKDWY